MTRSPNIVVTGAAGYLGGAVVRRLVRMPDERRIVCVDKATPAAPSGARPDPRVAQLSCDLTTRDGAERVASLLAGRREETTVVHLAALFVKDFQQRERYTWEDYRRHNVEATRLLVEALNRLESPWRIVFLSTAFIYHSGTDASADPLDDYGRSKLEAEEIIGKLTVPWSILRPVRVIGLDRVPPAVPEGVLPPRAFRLELSRQLEAGAIPFDIVSTFMRNAFDEEGDAGLLKIDAGNVTRSYLHVDDLATAVLSHASGGGPPGSVEDLSTTAPTTLATIGEAVVEELTRWGIRCALEVEEKEGDDRVVVEPPPTRSGWRAECDPSFEVIRRAARDYAASVAAGVRG